MTDTAGALLALLTADVNLKVYDGKVPVDSGGHPPTRPYVVLYAPSGRQTVNNLTGVSGWLEDVYQTTTVADEAVSLRIIQARVKIALLDVVPTVTGRLSFPIRHDFANPARRDDDLTPPVLYAVDEWRCTSVPSS